MSITIDNYTWDVPCEIDRVSKMTASEISGLMLNKAYFNDVIGTYLEYQVTIGFKPMRGKGQDEESDYYDVYELLTDPKSAHAFVFPYNGETVSITARVEAVEDVLMRLPGDVEYWQGITFKAISIYPSKTYTQSDASAAGMPALPDIESPSEGSTYTYTNGEWEVTDYDDADGTRY